MLKQFILYWTIIYIFFGNIILVVLSDGNVPTIYYICGPYPNTVYSLIRNSLKV